MVFSQFLKTPVLPATNINILDTIGDVIDGTTTVDGSRCYRCSRWFLVTPV